jgi:L-aminopeptidase/D-esterase-like protein
VYALATAGRTLVEPRAFALARLGALAADCLARAVARGVYEAERLGDMAPWRDRG